MKKQTNENNTGKPVTGGERNEDNNTPPRNNAQATTQQLKGADEPTWSKLDMPGNPGAKMFEKAGGIYKAIQYSRIVYIEASGAYCHISLTGDNSCTVTKHLGCIEKELQSDFFIRTHKSYLINMSHIVETETGMTGVRMICGTVVPISRRLRKHVREKILKYYKTG